MFPQCYYVAIFLAASYRQHCRCRMRGRQVCAPDLYPRFTTIAVRYCTRRQLLPRPLPLPVPGSLAQRHVLLCHNNSRRHSSTRPPNPRNGRLRHRTRQLPLRLFLRAILHTYHRVHHSHSNPYKLHASRPRSQRRFQVRHSLLDSANLDSIGNTAVARDNTGSKVFQVHSKSAPITPEMGVSARRKSSTISVAANVPRKQTFSSFFTNSDAGFIGMLFDDMDTIAAAQNRPALGMGTRVIKRRAQIGLCSSLSFCLSYILVMLGLIRLNC